MPRAPLSAGKRLSQVREHPMIIRPSRPEDSARLMAIWHTASQVGHPFLGEAVLQEHYAIVRDEHLVRADNWVAEDGGVISGFIGLIGNFIGGLFVDPAAHRRGIASRLIEHAAARLGALSVDVYEQNASALAFYKLCGFSVVSHKERDDEGRLHPLLTLHRP